MHAIELETQIDENREIHLRLPPHVQARTAKVVILYEEGLPSDAIEGALEGRAIEKRPARELGQFRGKVWMSDDFDAPLPDDFWLEGGS